LIFKHVQLFDYIISCSPYEKQRSRQIKFKILSIQANLIIAIDSYRSNSFCHSSFFLTFNPTKTSIEMKRSAIFTMSTITLLALIQLISAEPIPPFDLIQARQAAQSGAAQSSVTEPGAAQLTAAQPTSAQSIPAQPSFAEPTLAQPILAQPSAAQSFAAQSSGTPFSADQYPEGLGNDTLDGNTTVPGNITSLGNITDIGNITESGNFTGLGYDDPLINGTSEY
jgi:hypothetical protein